jgi:hypothetical protein
VHALQQVGDLHGGGSYCTAREGDARIFLRITQV